MHKREEKNDTYIYLKNCIKTILLSENFLQQIKIVVKLWKVWTISQPFCFLLWHWPSHFLPYWVCVDLVTMSCCFQAPLQWCWGFKPPVLWLLVIFSLVFFIQPNDPKSRNAYDAKRKTKRGWPKHRRRKIGLTAILLPTYKIAS